MGKIVFVYNADSGLFNTLTDFVHKLISPQTYACNLCAITHPLRMSDDWKVFIENLEMEVEFLHRDELVDRYGISDIFLPAVFRKDAEILHQIITADEINRCANLSELKTLVSDRLSVKT